MVFTQVAQHRCNLPKGIDTNFSLQNLMTQKIKLSYFLDRHLIARNYSVYTRLPRLLTTVCSAHSEYNLTVNLQKYEKLIHFTYRVLSNSHAHVNFDILKDN